MKPIELKVARIGNSRGVRLPAGTLQRYRIGDTVVLEERSDGILLRPRGPASAKLSWEDTAREMARLGEDWSEWDTTCRDTPKFPHPALDGAAWCGTLPVRPLAGSEPWQSCGGTT